MVPVGAHFDGARCEAAIKYESIESLPHPTDLSILGKCLLPSLHKSLRLGVLKFDVIVDTEVTRVDDTFQHLRHTAGITLPLFSIDAPHQRHRQEYHNSQKYERGSNVTGKIHNGPYDRRTQRRAALVRYGVESVEGRFAAGRDQLAEEGTAVARKTAHDNSVHNGQWVDFPLLL